MQAVLDVKIGNVDASALASAMDSQSRRTGGAALAMPDPTKNASAISSALSSPFTKLTAAVALGSVAASVISDILRAIFQGFQNAMRVWNAILTSISKMVEPFVNLLIPLLLPFLFITTQIARMLNIILMPLFAAMMKTAATAIAMAEKTGSPLPIIEAVKDMLFPGGATAQAAAAILGFAGGGAKEPTVEVPNFPEVSTDFSVPLKEIGDKINAVVQAPEWALGIHTSLSNLKSKISEVLNVIFPKKPEDGETKTIWDTISDWATKLNSIGLLIRGIFEEGLKFESIKTFLSDIYTSLKTAWDAATKYIDETLKPAITTKIGEIWDSLVSTASTFVGEVGKIFDKLIKWIEDHLPAPIREMLGLPSVPEQGDFLMRPGQAPVAFSPQDTIVGFKGGAPSMGGVTVNNTWNVSANGDRQVVELIRQTIEQHDATLSRAGYFQRGY